jgi:hypothetical protein
MYMHMSTFSEAIERRLDAIHRNYDSQFAGQARVTRDPGVLDTMLAELEGLEQELSGATAEEQSRLQERISERRTLYQGEAKAIRDTQADPRALEVHRVQSWVEVTRWRYQCFFAGQSRLSRDLALLSEMTEDLARTERDFSDLSVSAGDAADSQRVSVRNQLVSYGREREAITEARRTAEDASLAGAWAGLANSCFAVYRGRFAGRSRLARRPALLERVIESLVIAEQGLESLAGAESPVEGAQANLEIVRTNLAQYRTELVAVRQAKSEAGIASIIEALANAANELFSEYQEKFAGESRNTRDRAVLGQIIEGLYDAAKQMEELQRLGELQANTQNLRIVLDRVRIYLREDRLIMEAQQGKD